MSVFIALEIDDFQRQFDQAVNGAKGQGRRQGAGDPNVRRPLRGLEIKDDTYAYIKVITAAGEEIPLFDSSANGGQGSKYANFLLQSVQEARMEKQQIVETFGQPYIFFFGEAPRFLDVSAVLLNSFDFNWLAEWWENYDQYLRGTRLVDMGARMYLFYDDNVIEGYMLMAQTARTSDGPWQATLQFRLFITNYSNISFVGDDNYPIRSTAVLPDGVDLTNADAYSALNPVQPDQPPSQIALNQQAFLASLLSTGLIQETQEVQRITTQELLTKEEQQIALSQLTPSGFGGGLMLASVLRQGLSSANYPAQNIDNFVDTVGQLMQSALYAITGSTQPNPALQRTLPIRSQIYQNLDEYTSGGWQKEIPDVSVPGGPESLPGTYSPVGGGSQDPIGDLNQAACDRGAQLSPANIYGFGLVSFAPGQGFQSQGAFGRPSGAGSGFAGSVAPGFGLSGGFGLPFASGTGVGGVAGATLGGAPVGAGGGFGGSVNLINYLSAGGPSAPSIFGGSVGGGLSSLSAQGVNPGVGYGNGQMFGAGFNPSFGFTAGVGGAYGGTMGGAFGPGIGGGLGGYGAGPFGNPFFSQPGNPLYQNFLQSPYGDPTGTPYGLPVTSTGPQAQTVYSYTAGIGPDGRIQTNSQTSQFPVNGGFGSSLVGGPTSLFGGGPTMGAIASMGASVRGDGVFSLQAAAGTLNPSLTGPAPGNSCNGGTPLENPGSAIQVSL